MTEALLSPHRPPTLRAAQLSPSLGLGLHLEEEWVGEQGGECREKTIGTKLKGTSRVAGTIPKPFSFQLT